MGRIQLKAFDASSEIKTSFSKSKITANRTLVWVVIGWLKVSDKFVVISEQLL